MTKKSNRNDIKIKLNEKKIANPHAWVCLRLSCIIKTLTRVLVEDKFVKPLKRLYISFRIYKTKLKKFFFSIALTSTGWVRMTIKLS